MSSRASGVLKAQTRASSNSSISGVCMVFESSSVAMSPGVGHWISGGSNCRAASSHMLGARIRHHLPTVPSVLGVIQGVAFRILVASSWASFLRVHELGLICRTGLHRTFQPTGTAGPVCR